MALSVLKNFQALIKPAYLKVEDNRDRWYRIVLPKDAKRGKSPPKKLEKEDLMALALISG